MPAELRQVGENLVPGEWVPSRGQRRRAGSWPSGEDPLLFRGAADRRRLLSVLPAGALGPGRAGRRRERAARGCARGGAAGSLRAGRGGPGRCNPARGAGRDPVGAPPGQSPGQVPATGAGGEGFPEQPAVCRRESESGEGKPG